MLQYGLWDELRIDQGREWTLSLYVQELLAQYRTNLRRPPHLQSTSKKVSCKKIFGMCEYNFQISSKSVSIKM